METLAWILSYATPIALIIFFRSYFPSYLKTRVTDVAQKEDLDELTALVERTNRDHQSELEKTKTELTEQTQTNIDTAKTELTKQNSMEIETLKSKLQVEYETIKADLLRHSTKQFDTYNELWVSLCDLEVCVDELWEVASIKNLEDAAKQLRVTRETIRKSALIIEDGPYRELNGILNKFERFEFGEKALMDLRKGQAKREGIHEEEIQKKIAENADIQEQLKQSLEGIMDCLRGEIRDTEKP